MPHYVLDARTATPHFPGIGRYVRELAGALVPQLSAQERLTVLYAPGHALSLPAHPRVVQMPLAASPFSLRQQWQGPLLLRRLRADLYHATYVLMPYWPGMCALLTVYDLVPLRRPLGAPFQKRLLFCLAVRLALRAARHVLAISETTRREYMAGLGLPPERITTTPLAASPAFRIQSRQEIQRLREDFRLPRRFLLSVGTNKAHKNFSTLMTAFVRASLPEAALVIAGARGVDSRQNMSLGAQVADDPRILLPGRVPESRLPALYAAAAAFILPSRWEGFGLPVLEAMACGTPVLCARAGALPEVGGNAALYFDPENGAELAEALRLIWTDNALRVRLRNAGLQRAATFSWQHAAQRTLDQYRRICS